MPYIVTKPKPRRQKMTFEDVLFDLIDDRRLANMFKKTKTTGTKVHYMDGINRKWLMKIDLCGDMKRLNAIYDKAKDLVPFFDSNHDYEKQLEIKKKIELTARRNGENLSNEEVAQRVRAKMKELGLEYNDLYSTFYIPKRSGSGFRRIDAPCHELADYQRELKEFFEDTMAGNTYHTSAFAYIKGRSTKDLVRKLQLNKSRWILKLDFSNFFGSIDIDFTMNQLSKIFPFSEYIAWNPTLMRNCLKLCFLDGKLPQGTPFSPTLTNILMIPLDYEISNALYKDAQLITDFDKDSEEDERNYRLIYTRYADDIFIGSHRGFQYKPVLDYIRSIIEKNNAPFVIKPEKTRYGSFAGANWILGLMYNRNYDITVGSKKKKHINAMVHNFCKDYQNNIPWDPNDVQIVFGNLSYLGQIEPQSRRDLLNKYSSKFGFDVEQTMKECMKVEVRA